LVGGSDHDQPAVGPGDGALNQDEVVVGVDAHHVEVADGDALGAVVAGHADALLGPAATAVARVRGDAAVLAVALLDAVAAAQAAEVVPLHVAGEAAALASANYIDTRHVLEDVGGRQDRAHLRLRRGVEAELADEALRL